MKLIKQMKIIFFALLAGQVTYFIIALYLVISGTMSLTKDYSTTLGFIVPVIVIVFVVGSKIFYSYSIKAGTNKYSFEEKVSRYRTNNIVRYALLENANILTITCYLITGDFLYAALFVIVIGIFLINIPDEGKFKVDFQLTSEEKKILH